MSSLKLSRRLLYSVRFVFVSTFSVQRGRAFFVGITNLSKQAVCVKAKAPADHVYHRRTWDEFKRVLSVAHASQHVERTENLEYRNQLSGVCWGAVHCSSHIDLRIESIFLNRPVYCKAIFRATPTVPQRLSLMTVFTYCVLHTFLFQTSIMRVKLIQGYNFCFNKNVHIIRSFLSCTLFIPIYADSGGHTIWSRLIAGIAGSNPAKGIDKRSLYLLCCVGSGLYDELITTLPEKTYSESACKLETSTTGGVESRWAVFFLYPTWPRGVQ